MKNDGVDASEIRREYEDFCQEISSEISFEDYVYKYELHFQSDVGMEYDCWKQNIDSQIKKLQNIKCGYQQKKTKAEDNNNTNEKEKYEYLIGNLNGSIERLKKRRKDTFHVIDDIIMMASMPAEWRTLKSCYLDIAREGFRYTINCHDYIMFGMLPPSGLKLMQEYRRKNKNDYVDAFRYMVDEYEFIPYILKQVDKNVFLSDRKNIFNSAAGLFYLGDYTGFVYLLTPQIEGLFRLYMMLSGIRERAAGMKHRADTVNKSDENFWEYVYFAYEFPSLRNLIAHGDVVEITEETALITLADIRWLVEKISEDEHDYWKWNEFLVACTDRKCTLNNILEKFNRKKAGMDYPILMNLLKLYLEGSLDKAIEKADIKGCSEQLLCTLKSRDLYKAIWEDGKEQNVTEIDESYYDLVEYLNAQDYVPADWYDSFTRTVKESREKRRE